MGHAPHLHELRSKGRFHADQVARSLSRLDRDEGLVQVSALRRDFQKQKLILYTQGLSPEEVQAWSEGYNAILAEQLKAWLAAVQP